MEDRAWLVERVQGRAAELLAAPWPDPGRRVVRYMDPTAAALVLGSTQSTDIVDHDRTEAAGIDVVKRASGGGAVLVVPGDLLWVEVLVPAGDSLWDDDVGRAAWWLGQAWTRALDAIGVPVATVHQGSLSTNRWSSTICFAGLGPGEVTVEARKVVGISQRRTRAAARFQCAALLAPDASAVANLLVMDDGDRREAVTAVAAATGGVGATPAILEEALTAALPLYP